MSSEIKVQWYKGELTINIDFFFPTTKKRIKKLCDIINMDYHNSNEIYMNLMCQLQHKYEVEKKDSIKEKYRRNLEYIRSEFIR